MKYGIAASMIAAVVVVVGLTFIAGGTAEDDNPNVLSGTELTIDDWKACRAEVNARREKYGGDPIEELPVLKEDGQWHFSGKPGGAIYSCGTLRGGGPEVSD